MENYSKFSETECHKTEEKCLEDEDKLETTFGKNDMFTIQAIPNDIEAFKSSHMIEEHKISFYKESIEQPISNIKIASASTSAVPVPIRKPRVKSVLKKRSSPLLKNRPAVMSHDQIGPKTPQVMLANRQQNSIMFAFSPRSECTVQPNKRRASANPTALNL